MDVIASIPDTVPENIDVLAHVTEADDGYTRQFPVALLSVDNGDEYIVGGTNGKGITRDEILRFGELKWAKICFALEIRNTGTCRSFTLNHTNAIPTKIARLGAKYVIAYDSMMCHMIEHVTGENLLGCNIRELQAKTADVSKQTISNYWSEVRAEAEDHINTDHPAPA